MESDYENIRQRVAAIPNASDPSSRVVAWLSSAQVLGVARDTDGRIEIFLRGERVAPLLKVVRDAIDYRVVYRKGHPPFDASRVLLPAIDYFDNVAAFICTELLRTGVDETLEAAFAATEPLIALAINQFMLTQDAVIGLAGELLVLDALCRRAEGSQIALVVSGWQGWKRSARDLTVGGVGIEVKTTVQSFSIHHIEGTHQVEVQANSGGAVDEDSLILISVGLQHDVSGDSGFTIPMLVDRIVSRMEYADASEGSVATFLARLSEYGNSTGGGYVHSAESTQPQYLQAFHPAFMRAYDMADPEIAIPRTEGLVDFIHLQPDSLRFEVRLPATLNPTNPIAGANRIAKAIIG
jgi:hypothetical protein